MIFIKIAISLAVINYHTSLTIETSKIPPNCSDNPESIQHLSEFFIQENYLGEGSFGKVYSFQDEVTKEKMAVKIINIRTEKAFLEIMKEIAIMKEFYGHFDLIGISSYDSCFYEQKSEEVEDTKSGQKTQQQFYTFYLIMEAMDENLLSLILNKKNKYNRQLVWQLYVLLV